MDTTSEEDADKNQHPHWINAVVAGKKSKNVKCMILLKKEKIVFQIDTGATVNMLPAKYLKHIKPFQGVLTT